MCRASAVYANSVTPLVLVFSVSALRAQLFLLRVLIHVTFSCAQVLALQPACHPLPGRPSPCLLPATLCLQGLGMYMHWNTPVLPELLPLVVPVSHTMYTVYTIS